MILNVQIDGNLYQIKIRVIPDTLMQYPLLIGTDFLSNIQVTIEVTIKEGKISISKPQESESDALPEIYKINCIDKTDELDLSHITNVEYHEIVNELIND